MPEGIQSHKVTVNLTQKSWDAANETTKATEMTRTDLINRAIQVYAYLQAEITKGSEVLIRDKDSDTADRVKFL